MQARRISRELALLSLSQLSTKSELLDAQQLQTLIVSAVRTLTVEVREALELAASELEKGSDRLLSSQTRAADIVSAREYTQQAIDTAQAAINHMGTALDLPEFIQMSNQQEVREYAIALLRTVHTHQKDIDALLTASMVDWQLNRLLRLDQDILRIAVGEILYLGTPDRVAINEAIELSKKYGDEDSHRFINGVLRRVTEQIARQSLPTQHP